MTLSDTTQTELLAMHPKPIAHMWRQIQEHRFGLVFGAGISMDFDLPDWDELISRIAGDPEVSGRSILNNRKRTQATWLAEILFQHFASRVIATNRAITQGEVRRMWRDVVRRQLYKKARKKDATYMSRHPYMRYYLPLIRRIPMTVNYNFDNFIERFLELERNGGGSSGERAKPYEVIWRPDIHPRRKKGVVYHPNGFLPDNTAEPASDALVFREDEFAGQLTESISGRYASLLHFLSRHTCLLIGLSLNDATLKHLLRQSAQLNPGHFHYYIAFEDAKKPTPPTAREAVFEANFEVHNLITLFLTERQIAALGILLTLNAQDLCQRANAKNTNLRYYYYVTGVPCAGKSSAISHLRSFTTYDEWLDARLPHMSKHPKPLAPTTVREIDDWVAKQFAQKNLMLSDSEHKGIGLHILDRCMLDPMSFKEEDERPERAQQLLDTVCGEKRRQPIQDGMIVLLEGASEVIEQRCLAAGKEFSRKQIETMQNVLRKAYQGKGKHLHVIDTRHRSRPAVIKDIVRRIFTLEYDQMNIKRRLQRIESKRMRW